MHLKKLAFGKNERGKTREAGSGVNAAHRRADFCLRRAFGRQVSPLELPAALPEEVLTVALSKGVKRDPTIGFLLSVQNSTPTATGSVGLEASTNLVNWTALATNAAPTGL